MASGWKTGKRAAELITGRFLLLLVLMLVMWGVYWFAAYRITGLAMEHAALLLSGRNGTATCSEGGVRGFPVAIHADCQSFRLDHPEGQHSTLAGAEANVLLLRPWEFTAILKAPFALSLPRVSEPITAHWSQAKANAHMSWDGLSTVNTWIRDLRLEAFDVPPLVFDVADLAVTPEGEDYRLKLDVNGKVTSRTGPATLPLAAVANFTALSFGPSLGNDPLATVTDWLRSGGDLRLDRGSITVDQTVITLAGGLSLSPEGLLSGDVTATLAGLDTLPQTGEVIVPGLSTSASQFVTMVKGLGRRTIKDDGSEAYELPLRVRNGIVSLGIIPIAQIPAIEL